MCLERLFTRRKTGVNNAVERSIGRDGWRIPVRDDSQGGLERSPRNSAPASSITPDFGIFSTLRTVAAMRVGHGSKTVVER